MVFTGIRGRDGSTSNPLGVKNGLAVECLNVDLDGTSVGTKRRGHQAMTVSTAWPHAGAQRTLLVHVPGAALTGAELWGTVVAPASGIGRFPVSTANWASVTHGDSVLTVSEVNGVSFNGKFFLTFASAAERLHVYDSAGIVRRVGRAAPSNAPTVANTGSSTYAALERWYQQSYRVKSGSTVLAEGERSASVAFTPSGTGAAARVTQSAGTPDVGTTHWVLWVSPTSTSGPFYELAETAIGTTTYDDSTDPADYADGTRTAAQTQGMFTVPRSVKYLLVDGSSRLLLAGDHASSGAFHSRVWFTTRLGALGRGDDERVPDTSEFKYWIDLDEKDGGSITGLGGPINGQPIVFKERQTWRLVQTNEADAPYQPRAISKAIGCINHRSIAMGEDESGNPALYFAGSDGIYRFGASGLQYIGRDVQDVWDSRDGTTVFGVFYHREREYWVFVRSSGGTTTRLRFDARLGRPDETGQVRGGWMKDSGTTAISSAIACVMLPHSPGSSATDVSVPVPHVLLNDGTILRCDAGVQDNSSNYQAYTEVAPQAPAGVGVRVKTGAPLLVAKSSTGTPTITVTQQKNYSAETRDATVAITTTRSHTLCEQGCGMEGCDAIGFRMGDGSAQNSGNWTLDAVIVPWQEDGEVTQL
jgi:hypothetical protein